MHGKSLETNINCLSVFADTKTCYIHIHIYINVYINISTLFTGVFTIDFGQVKVYWEVSTITHSKILKQIFPLA